MVQVSECTNPDPHDWTLCAFAHVGEKAKRRDPAIFKYVATACPDFRKVRLVCSHAMNRLWLELAALKFMRSRVPERLVT
jgi:hypothetical protein